MLYLTTRDKFDAYTKAHPLKGDRAGNGGLYIPFRMPRYSDQDLLLLKDKSVSQIIADVLNTFFKTDISSWDVEFAIGRYPLRLQTMNHRIIAAELWHNSENSYAKLENSLAAILQSDGIPDWVRIAARIAVVFACYGEMLHSGCVAPGQSFDAAAATGDFTAVMALWYARHMGLPIGNIVCGCNENSAVWDLLHIGEFKTDETVTATTTPEADLAVPEDLERLICGTLGVDETLRYCQIVGRGGLYAPAEGQLETLRAGMYAAVVSVSRLEGLIPSVQRTNGYVLNPYTALAYGALQDYRARTGQSAPALLLADKHPVCDCRTVASAMGITETELMKMMNEA